MLARVILAVVVCWGAVPAAAHEDKYPMPAEQYRKRSEQRVKRYRERLEQRMAEHHLEAKQRAAARKRLESIVVQLRELVAKHAKDGTITKAEAHDVRKLGKKLRDALYRELGFPRDKGE
jgi:hypothetical protein